MNLLYSGGVGLMSAGIYLRVIRDRRHISRADLARQIGVSVQTIANIENGEKEPGSSVMFAFIDRVHARLEDVAALMLARDDENEAYRRADAYLSRSAVDVLRSEIGDERAARAATFLAANPSLIDALIRMGHELSPEGDDRSGEENRPLNVPRSAVQH